MPLKFERSTPSTMISGDELSVNVLTPRMKRSEKSSPGAPLRCVAMSPGMRPTSMLLMLACGVWTRSSIEMVAIAAVTLSFRCLPYPTTTTSLSMTASSFMTIVMSDAAGPTLYSRGLNPR